MKDFKEIVYDAARVKKELAEFSKLLKSNPSLSERKDIQPFFKKKSLSERKDIQPFFKKRDQLSAFMGTYAEPVFAGSEGRKELTRKS